MAAMTWEQQQQLRQLGVAQGLNPQQLQQAGQQMLTPQPQTPMAFPRQQVRPQSAYQPWAQQEARRQPLIPPKPAARPQPAYQPPPKGGPQGNAQYLGGPMARPPLIPPKPAAQPKYGQPPTYDPAAAPKRPTAAKPPAQTPSGNQAGQGQPVRAIPPGQPVNVVAPGKERTEATTDPRANPATGRIDPMRQYTASNPPPPGGMGAVPRDTQMRGQQQPGPVRTSVAPPPQSRPPAQQPAPQRPPVQQPPPQRPQTSAQNIMGGGWSGDVNTGSTYGEMNDPMAGYYAGLQQQSQPSRQPLVPSARPQGGGQGAVPFDTGMYGPVPPSGRPQFGNQPPRQAAPPMPGRGYDPNQDNYGMPGSITRPDEAMYATIGQPIQPRGVVDMPSYRPPVQSSQQRPPLIPPKPRR